MRPGWLFVTPMEYLRNFWQLAILLIIEDKDADANRTTKFMRRNKYAICKENMNLYVCKWTQNLIVHNIFFKDVAFSVQLNKLIE